MIKFLFRPILNKIEMFCVQTEVDRQRLMCLGVLETKIRVTGNMKFDITDYTELKNDYTDYRKKIGLESDEKLLVAASTHLGEEKIILSAYKSLLFEFCDLRLLIAPRHPQRAQDLEKLVLKNGFNRGRTDVFILDTVGELVSYYAISDVVFVGGSLVKKGGHNILEPAALGKPILFGPYMSNFRDIAELFLRKRAGILVHNAKDLQEKIKYLLNNPLEKNQICDAAKQVILENQGATQRNLEILKDIYAKVSL